MGSKKGTAEGRVDGKGQGRAHRRGAGGGLVVTAAGTMGDAEVGAAEAAGNGPADMGYVSARREAGVMRYPRDRSQKDRQSRPCR